MDTRDGQGLQLGETHFGKTMVGLTVGSPRLMNSPIRHHGMKTCCAVGMQLYIIVFCSINLWDIDIQ